MTRLAPIRVLIADDYADVRNALGSLIEAEVDLELAGAASDADEAVELAAREQPDVALVDTRMPAGGGVAAASGIAACSPQTRVIALSASGVIPETMDTSVVGCLLKGSPINHIVESVKRAAAGQPLPSWSPAPRSVGSPLGARRTRR